MEVPQELDIQFQAKNLFLLASFQICPVSLVPNLFTGVH